MSKSPTYQEIATSYSLWKEYADPEGRDSKEWFEFKSVEQKVKILVECFGEEPAVG